MPIVDRWLTPEDHEASAALATDDGALDVAPGPWHVVWDSRNDGPSLTLCGLRAHGGWWRDPRKIEQDRWPTCVVCDDLHDREARLDYGRISAEMDQAEARTSRAGGDQAT